MFFLNIMVRVTTLPQSLKERVNTKCSSQAHTGYINHLNLRISFKLYTHNIKVTHQIKLKCRLLDLGLIPALTPVFPKFISKTWSFPLYVSGSKAQGTRTEWSRQFSRSDSGPPVRKDTGIEPVWVYHGPVLSAPHGSCPKPSPPCLCLVMQTLRLQSNYKALKPELGQIQDTLTSHVSPP